MPLTEAPKKRPASIRDVARHAGVSVGTVSRVLHGAKNIDPDIYQRTMKAIKAKQYQPKTIAQLAAKSLFKKNNSAKTGNIGVIFYNISNKWRESQIYMDYISGIEKACSDSGYHPIVEIISEPIGPEFPRCVSEGKVEGILLQTDQFDNGFLLKLNEAYPLVLMNTYHPSLPISQVCVNDHGAAVALVEQIISAGHERIAFINPQPHHAKFISRSQGYAEAMKVNRRWQPGGLIEEQLVQETSENGEIGVLHIDTVLDKLMREQAPTAIILANDWLACESYKAFKRLGIKIGEDVSIASFDNTLPLCEMLDPTLSSFALPFRTVAEESISVLLEQIEGRETQRSNVPKIHMISGQFVRRESLRSLPPKEGVQE